MVLEENFSVLTHHFICVTLTRGLRMSKTAGPHAGNKMAVSGKAGSTHKMTKSKTTGANHSNGLITSPAAAVSATDALDECPPLVSSDEEEVEVAETAGECV